MGSRMLIETLRGLQISMALKLKLDSTILPFPANCAANPLSCGAFIVQYARVVGRAKLGYTPDIVVT